MCRHSDETIEEYLSYAKRRRIRSLLHLSDGGENLVSYDMEKETAEQLKYTDYVHREER